ncbi:MAG: histidine kinase [Bacteroidota bacterium]
MNFKLTRSDIYLVLFFYAFSIPLSMADYQEYEKMSTLYVEVITYVLIDTFSVYMIVFVLFPRYLTQKRYFTLLTLILLLFFVTGFISINIYCSVGNCNGNPLSFIYLYYGFVTVVESAGILATFVLGKKVFDAQVNYLKLEKEKKESELRWLKSQIDPHFLFNNLNTVDALIDSDPQMAKVYINKLSQLYRYLISSQDQEVVLLEEELDFARNYMFLIESRYGKAYQFEIVDERNSDDPVLIPPGALQTLLENIVKHNQASAERPVHSVIGITDQFISISNDLRPKKQEVESMGTGLNNLKSRYKLLSDRDIRIETKEQFMVELPMIKQVA